MKRFATVLLVLATWPLLTAGGGFNPPPPGFKTTGPAVSATIVMNVVNGAASVRLSKGTLSAGTTWTMDSDILNLQFSRGCLTDQAAMDLRFKHASLVDYGVPQATVIAMFAALGIAATGQGGANEPIITDVDSAACTPAGLTSGVLSFNALIQFLVPSPRNN
jgi:hypothetical protein